MSAVSLPPVDWRERVRLEGVAALGDVELIALLLGTGTSTRPVSVIAAELLASAGGLTGLAREGLQADAPSLEGVGEAKRARIEAALELGRRTAVRHGLLAVRSLANPPEVAQWAHAQLGHASHEELWLLALNGRHGLLAVRRVAQGGSSGCATSTRDILRIALRTGAAGFVLVHNHPSGDPTPSVEDARMSLELGRAARVVGLSLVDHVIVGGGRHASLYELGLLQNEDD